MTVFYFEIWNNKADTIENQPNTYYQYFYLFVFEYFVFLEVEFLVISNDPQNMWQFFIGYKLTDLKNHLSIPINFVYVFRFWQNNVLFGKSFILSLKNLPKSSLKQFNLYFCSYKKKSH